MLVPKNLRLISDSSVCTLEWIEMRGVGGPSLYYGRRALMDGTRPTRKISYPLGQSVFFGVSKVGKLSGQVFHCLIDWLTDRLIDRLTDLIDWLIDWFDWLIDWFLMRSLGCRRQPRSRHVILSREYKEKYEKTLWVREHSVIFLLFHKGKIFSICAQNVTLVPNFFNLCAKKKTFVQKYLVHKGKSFQKKYL